MQIQLKEAEIVSALKQYIQSQGINLQGKTVEIKFTAGRKEAGLSADLVIEDAAQPTLGLIVANDQAPLAPINEVKSIGTATSLLATAETDKALAEPVAVAQNDSAIDGAVTATGTDDVQPEKKTTSLFG